MVGETYDVEPQAVSGALGPGVTSGSGKRIVTEGGDEESGGAWRSVLDLHFDDDRYKMKGPS
jgi:hypothetical protein